MKRLCKCGRPALFKTNANKRFRADSKHKTCQRCWRRLMDSIRAKQMAEAA